MVYAEVLYDVATIRKIQGFYLKDPPVASCRCFFFMSFRSGAFLAKKVTGRLYLRLSQLLINKT